MKSLQQLSRSALFGSVAAAAVSFAAMSSPLHAQTIQEEFAAANAQLEALLLTNQQLRQRIDRQEQLLVEMAASIEHAAMLSDEDNSPLNGIVERMMSDIERFVEQDLPFELEARRDQVARIRGLVNNPLAPLAQKLNLVIALYQAEGAYGRSLETYETAMEVNGVEQEVTVTRIGRIMLAYQTADRSVTAVWDNNADQWVELPPGEYRNAITRAQSVASGTLAAELINIPIAAPVAAN
jgi:hypothetical protein